MAARHDNDITTALDSDIEQGARQLMNDYGERIYWHVRRLVVSHDDAQDATQETFVRVLRNYRQFDGRSSFGAWIYRIATNEALRLIERRRDGHISIEGSAGRLDNIATDDYIDYSDTMALKLQKAILALPAKQQLAFNMRYYDNMSYDDIAAATGSTVNNVKSNYHTAKEKIKRYMTSNI